MSGHCSSNMLNGAVSFIENYLSNRDGKNPVDESCQLETKSNGLSCSSGQYIKVAKKLTQMEFDTWHNVQYVLNKVDFKDRDKRRKCHLALEEFYAGLCSKVNESEYLCGNTYYKKSTYVNDSSRNEAAKSTVSQGATSPKSAAKNE